VGFLAIALTWCSPITVLPSNRGPKKFPQLIKLVFRPDTRVTLALELINRQGAEEEKAFVPCSSSSNSFWCWENIGHLGFCHLCQTTKLRLANHEFSIDMEMAEEPGWRLMRFEHFL
jgi:hypothetical protein